MIFKGVFRVFKRCFKEVSRKCSRCFKKISCSMALIAASRAEGGLVFLSNLVENVFGESDGPMCSSSVEMLKLSKKYSGKESETNV